MKDAHEILKKITVPDDLLIEYLNMIEEFPKRPISMTLNDVKEISKSN
jgi:hypothetical protein